MFDIMCVIRWMVLLSNKKLNACMQTRENFFKDQSNLQVYCPLGFSLHIGLLSLQNINSLDLKSTRSPLGLIFSQWVLDSPSRFILLRENQCAISPEILEPVLSRQIYLFRQINYPSFPFSEISYFTAHTDCTYG